MKYYFVKWRGGTEKIRRGEYVRSGFRWSDYACGNSSFCMRLTGDGVIQSGDALGEILLERELIIYAHAR